MTKQMYDDYIKSLKKKQKALIAVIIIISALLIGMTIFAFSEFEISIESNDTYKIEQTQTAEGEGNITLNQESLDTTPGSNVYTICGTVIVCILIIVIGLVVYGKSKSKPKNNNQEKEKDNN